MRFSLFIFLWVAKSNLVFLICILIHLYSYCFIVWNKHGLQSFVHSKWCTVLPSTVILVHFLHHFLLLILSETADLWHISNAAGATKVYELLPALRNCWSCLHLPLDPPASGSQRKAERARISGKGWDRMRCGLSKIRQNLFKCTLESLRFVTSTPEPTFSLCCSWY